MQSSKRNLHPACGCRMCRAGAGTDAGQETHRHVNRQIRRLDKGKLNQLVRSGALEELEDFEPSIISTTYTD